MLSSTFAVDEGRPSFNILQNYGSSKAPVLYFVFDVMVLAASLLLFNIAAEVATILPPLQPESAALPGSIP